MRGITIATLAGIVVWTLLFAFAILPSHARPAEPVSDPAAFTVVTMVFQTPNGLGADSHVHDGTLDDAACQAALHDILAEWPDLTPVAGFCTPLTPPPGIRGSLTGPTLACMRVQGLARAKRGCV